MCKIWGLPKALVVKTSLRPLKHPSQTGPSYSHFGIFVVLAGVKSLNHFLLTGHRQLHCTGALTGTINLNVMAAKSKVTPSLQWMMIKKNLNHISIETHKDHERLNLGSPKKCQIQFCWILFSDAANIHIYGGNGLCQALCVADIVYMRFMNNKKGNIKICGFSYKVETVVYF